MQLRGWREATVRVSIIAVDQDGASHYEVTAACRELDAALRGGAGAGRGSAGDASRDPAPYIEALLRCCDELHAGLPR